MHVIESITIDGIRIENEHRLNAIRTKGTLPQDKETMLRNLSSALDRADDDFLNTTLNRTSL